MMAKLRKDMIPVVIKSPEYFLKLPMIKYINVSGLSTIKNLINISATPYLIY